MHRAYVSREPGESSVIAPDRPGRMRLGLALCAHASDVIGESLLGSARPDSLVLFRGRTVPMCDARKRKPERYDEQHISDCDQRPGAHRQPAVFPARTPVPAPRTVISTNAPVTATRS